MSRVNNLLQKVSSLLRTNIHYLVQGGFWLAIARVISSLSSFILALLFGNLLAKETYGTYTYILSIATILSIPTLSGVGTALIRSIAQGNDGDVLPALKEKLRFGTLASAASVIVGVYYITQGNTDFGISFLLIAVFLPLLEAFSLYSSILTGKKLFKESTYYTAITQTAIVVSMAVTLLLTHNIFLIVLAYYIPRIVCRFIFFRLSQKFLSNTQQKDVRLLSLGRHFTALEIMGSISSQIDRIALFQFLGPASVATYSFSIAPITHMQAMLKSLLTLALPKFSEREFSVIQNTLPRKLLIFLVGLLGVTGVYILFAPYFFTIFFPQYMDAVLYSQVAALILLFFPQKLISTALTAHAQKKALYVSNITSSVLKIGSLLIFIPLFGVWGAIYSLLIQYASNAIVLWGYFLTTKNA
jgi:O-antigen/teichoic acid export membrane protein